MRNQFARMNIWWKLYFIWLILGIISIPARTEGIGDVLTWIAIGFAVWLTLKINRKYLHKMHKLVRVLIGVVLCVLLFIPTAFVLTYAVYAAFSI